jgi:hypothetical protein
MRSRVTWKLAACTAALALSVNHLECKAFAEGGGSESPFPTTPPGTAASSGFPSRPQIEATRVVIPAPKELGVPPSRAAAFPAQAAKKRSGLKWVLLAAVGASAAALVISKRGVPHPVYGPTISLGQPVAGPQPGQPAGVGDWDY